MQVIDKQDYKVLLFQSAPGREAGRCTSPAQNATAPESFNPRPAVRPGDATKAGNWSVALTFQSAPGREAGRCAVEPAHAL